MARTAFKREVLARAQARGIEVTAESNLVLDIALEYLRELIYGAIDKLFQPFITAPAALWSLAGIKKGSAVYNAWVGLFRIDGMAGFMRAVVTGVRDKLKAIIGAMRF